ncbi:MAG: DUF262 domain-containing HNH endonuclease family protein [Chloroflexi bacterium]|nr:DUF262 domain-containing HNH endonuclease family protein [Chloroflexota bacterium]
MPETIKASEQNIDRVFSNDYLFEIPVYQRPYAWDTEQVDDLLDDLLYAMRRPGDEPYFLGSIVLIKGDDADSQVVDGQQRLTTLTMMLCVLRDLSEGQIKLDLDRYIRQQGSVIAGTKEVVRFKLRDLDRNFFYTNVQSDGGVSTLLENPPHPGTDSQERILENAKYLHEKLSALDADERTSLAAFVIQHCYLVVVSTSDMTSAYRIFSVMNDRGLDLSVTDILKAEIIGELPNDAEQRIYADKWEDIEQELGRDSFGSLFAHIRSVYAKAKQRRGLQEEFREHVLKQHAAIDFVDSVLDQYDDAYKTVLGLPADGINSAQTTGRYLAHLRRLDNDDWIPPAMSFIHRYRQNPGASSRFTKDLERLAYGLFIRRADINERIRRYGEVLNAIEQGEAIWQEDGPLQLTPNEKNQIKEILAGPIYTLPRVPRPLLLRLDSLLADAGATYEHSIISIEHVIPQNPSDGSLWLDWFPDEEVRAHWTHRLANLVLLSHRKNTSASNWEFDRKKTQYFLRGGTSPFALTTQVVAENKWGPDVLERRQSDLIDRLNAEWRLD